MTYFEKPDHSYHRVIFEFTDKERKGTGIEQFSLQPGPLEILQALQRIADKDKKQLDIPWTFSMPASLEDLQRKKDLWKAKAVRLIGFLNNKDTEAEILNRRIRRLLRENELYRNTISEGGL